MVAFERIRKDNRQGVEGKGDYMYCPYVFCMADRGWGKRRQIKNFYE